VILLVCIVKVVASPKPPELDWHPLAAFLDVPGRAGDVVLFTGGRRSDWFTGYQVMGYRHASSLPPGRPIAEYLAPAPERFANEVRARERVWLVHLADLPPDLRGMPEGWAAYPADVPGFPQVVWELRARQ
jgi:hypothetical protein